MSRTENTDDEKQRKKVVPTAENGLHMGVAKIFATDVEPPVELITSSRQRLHLVF
ncbi:hypothetical protein M405DRAFT_859591 [Rhizopogon salebrosus TDB-379]|nr:hypothetical protein M405DRAFT_859591 [Rhizopogon salebrosus TDB-379]